MRTIKLPALLGLLATLSLAGGCLFRLPIQQGNMLNENSVAQLEPGMTRKQVMFLLGTPMVPNGFDTDRWDYYYFYKAPRGDYTDSSRLTVWFKDDKVERLEGDAVPKPKTAVAPPAG